MEPEKQHLFWFGEVLFVAQGFRSFSADEDIMLYVTVALLSAAREVWLNSGVLIQR